MEHQFHHYIPRFILRKFATNNYNKENPRVGICGGPNNSIELGPRKPKKKPNKNKNPFINIMSSNGVLKKEKISTTYGVTNMYKDPNATDAMEVEKLLATLEADVSVIFRRIIESAQHQDIKLTRLEMRLVKKFLFVMTYRKDRRRNQYITNTFDFITGMMMRKFMEEQKIESPERVWLNNIRTILEASDLDQLLSDDSKPLFPTIRSDLEAFLRCFFICLWKAPPGTEFLISNCAFGLWEGCGPSLIYHQFYPVSPTIMLVQAFVKFKSDQIGQSIASMAREMNARRSWFENVPHPLPKTFYKKTGSDKLMRFTDGGGDEHDPLDEYTYTFVEIPKEAINRINAITIDESVQISFTSELCFYKSLKYYSRVINETENRIDVKPMIQELLKKLREGL